MEIEYSNIAFSKLKVVKIMAKDYWYWARWQKANGFDIANTNCLNGDEKIILLKGMPIMEFHQR